MMKKKKRLLLCTMAAAMCLSLTPVMAGAAFSDVLRDAWYATDVNDVQRYGLIEGIGNNRFDPDGKLSLAQAVTLAVRTHATLNNNSISYSGSVWYQPYVDYALQNNLMKQNEFGGQYDANCDRQTMAVLFKRVFPQNTENNLNSIPSIPDVENNGYGADIYYLYRQGVLTGNDSFGTFKPYSGITRAETAAILNRVMDPSKRKTVQLVEQKSVKVDRPYEAALPDLTEDNWHLYMQLLSDNTLYLFVGIPQSDIAVIMKGTWSQSGNTITLKTYEPSGASYSGTYEITSTSSNGYSLKQTSDEGIVYAHKGSVFSFKSYSGFASNKNSMVNYVNSNWESFKYYDDSY